MWTWTGRISRSITGIRKILSVKYTAGDIAAICGAQATGPGEAREVLSVFTDSRNPFVSPGSLFFAISGKNHDGHSYINELYRRGVRVFVIEKDIAVKSYPEAVFLRVESSIGALQRLAADYRRQFRGTLAAVTGSNGKTVVKEWIAALAPENTRLFRSPKSYNSQIGVPLSVLMMDGGEQFAVIEAGISRPGEMECLEAILRPDIGIITNIGDAHQENFRTLADKAREKTGLFKNCRAIIYNGDPVVSEVLRKDFPPDILIDAGKLDIDVSFLPDKASREDALLAAVFCQAAGFPAGDTARKLRTLTPVAMRLELKEGLYGSLIVDDTYNSDINSLAIALDHLNSVAGGREQILILSDILQSGYAESELYGKVGEMIGRSKIKKVFAVGEAISRHTAAFPVPATAYGSVTVFLSSIDYREIANRAVLVKGNRGSRFEQISHSLELRSHTTVLEIDTDALIHNLNVYRSLIPPGTRIMAMIKALGYGHGNYELASLLQHYGVDYLAVAFADEGAELRRRGINLPIVVLNADEGSYDLMLAHRLEPEIYSFRSLSMFAALLARHGERDYPVHIKLDTGMHRLGFTATEMEELAQTLAGLKGSLRAASVFSHLASSDDPAHDSFTCRQIADFTEMANALSARLGYRPLLHIANSAAIGRIPDSAFDMVRLGIGLYGVGTSEVKGLREVSRLKTRIVQIKDIPPGETVGYGRCGIADAGGTVIATLPVGYADGIDRRLGDGNWSVLINGRFAPTIGRICMDTMMVDISDLQASEGDEVTVIGGLPDNSIEALARTLGTIPYEIMTGISARVKRIFIKE